MCNISKLYDKIIRNSKEAERQYLSMATKPIVSKAEKLKESPMTDEAFNEQLERVLRNNVLDTDIRITGDTVIGATKNLNREIPEWSDNFEEAVADLIEKAKQGKCDSLSPIEEGNKLLAIVKHGKVNQQGWSEEDERILKGIIGLIDHDQHYGVSNKEMLNWLKSLRPTWKPSEEQMSALVSVTKNLFAEMPERHRLESLHKDLKKLM